MRSFSTLVSTEWLSQNAALVKIIDGSWHMPMANRNASAEFLQRRIKDSSFFDIDLIADQASKLPHMIPDARIFSEKIGKMGISENDHVVVYDSSGIGPSCRVFWTFKVFGHERVSVLDGGLLKWMNEKRDIENGPIKDAKECNYKSKFRPDLVKNFNDIQDVLKDGSSQILDARSAGRFKGIENEPRAGIPSGSMPGSINIPFTDLIDPVSKTLLSKEQLKSLFKRKNVDLNKPIITTCGTGITASVIYFALDYLGVKGISVYDGSWTEYACIPGSKIFKDSKQL